MATVSEPNVQDGDTCRLWQHWIIEGRLSWGDTLAVFQGEGFSTHLGGVGFDVEGLSPTYLPLMHIIKKTSPTVYPCDIPSVTGSHSESLHWIVFLHRLNLLLILLEEEEQTEKEIVWKCFLPRKLLIGVSKFTVEISSVFSYMLKNVSIQVRFLNGFRISFTVDFSAFCFHSFF